MESTISYRRQRIKSYYVLRYTISSFPPSSDKTRIKWILIRENPPFPSRLSFQFHPSIKYISKFFQKSISNPPSSLPIVINLWIRITQILELISTKWEDWKFFFFPSPPFPFFSLSLIHTRHRRISRGTRKEGFKEESLALQGDGKSGDGWLVEEIRRDTLGDRDRDQFLEGYSRGRDGVVRLAHGWINYPSLQGEEERWMRPRCWESPALLIEPPIMLPTRSRFELIGRNKISDGHARFAKISRPSIIIRAEWGWYRGVGEKSTTREIREFIYIWTRSWNEFFFFFFDRFLV